MRVAWFVLVALAALFPARAAAQSTGLTPGMRLRFEIDDTPELAAPVGGETTAWAQLRNTGDAPLTPVRMVVVPPSLFDEPDAGDYRAFSTESRRNVAVRPYRYENQAVLVGNGGTALDVLVHFAPKVAGPHRAYLLVEVLPGGLWWAFEMVGATPGALPPDPRTPPDQLVRVGKKGWAKLTPAHARYQLGDGDPAEVDRVAASAADRLAACRTAPGSVAVGLMVSPAGAVVQVDTAGGTAPDEVKACVGEALAAQRFPAAAAPRIYRQTL